MQHYDTAVLLDHLRSTGTPVVLFGAGDIGRLAWHALDQEGVTVTCFADGRTSKQGTTVCGVPVRGPAELGDLAPEAVVFLCGNYLRTIPDLLARLGFTRVHDCARLLTDVDLRGRDTGLDPVVAERTIALHALETRKAADAEAGALVLKYLDVVVTEACSMKCQDCSNLMQYYSTPRHSDIDLLLASVERILDAVDRVYEFRVLGGEPFVNPRVHRVLDRLVAYPDCEKVIVYTNGTIVPREETMRALEHPKVVVYVTDYGEHSRKLGPLLDALTERGVAHTVKIPEWTDSGRIRYVERSGEVLDDMFANCGVNDVLTLLNGRLYRCPFSANATNLGAVPTAEADVVDLTADPDGDGPTVREQVRRLHGRTEHLTACAWCNGRDYRTPRITPALQIRRPLPLDVVGGPRE